MDELDFMIIFKTEHLKKRIGNENDGGYVILDGFDYDLLLSCGISNDTSFENNFLELNKSTQCYAFDGTINSLPKNSNKNINFIQKNISKENSEKCSNMLDIIENNDNIFLKMDIETWEYDWIKILEEKHLNKFKQIVIEFHFAFTYSEEIFKKFSYPIEVIEKIECIKKISNTHYLVHFHGNNCCGVCSYKGITIPNVFECTFVRKDLCNNVSLNDKSIPDILLDKPNISNKPDITLRGYPYTI